MAAQKDNIDDGEIETSSDEELKSGLPLERFLTYRITRIQAKLSAQGSRIVKRHAGITLAQWRIIAHIGDDENITLSAISRRYDMDKGQLSRTINSMISSGLLIARDSESDHRQNYLSLSTKGLSIYRKMLPKMRERQKFLLERMNEDERELFNDILDRLDLASEADIL